MPSSSCTGSVSRSRPGPTSSSCTGSARASESLWCQRLCARTNEVRGHSSQWEQQGEADRQESGRSGGVEGGGVAHVSRHVPVRSLSGRDGVCPAARSAPRPRVMRRGSRWTRCMHWKAREPFRSGSSRSGHWRRGVAVGRRPARWRRERRRLMGGAAVPAEEARPSVQPSVDVRLQAAYPCGLEQSDTWHCEPSDQLSSNIGRWFLTYVRASEVFTERADKRLY